jgi:hypothetical protein
VRCDLLEFALQGRVARRAQRADAVEVEILNGEGNSAVDNVQNIGMAGYAFIYARKLVSTVVAHCWS